MARGFVYLVAVMDWFSRRVLAWRLSIGMKVEFCLEALREAMTHHGLPEIFNTDQGVQFTSGGFVGELENHHSRASMDRRGRYLDNIFIERLWRSLKYEEVFIKAVASVAEARGAIAGWVLFYNDTRPHQALGYQMPREIHQATPACGQVDNARALTTSPHAHNCHNSQKRSQFIGIRCYQKAWPRHTGTASSKRPRLSISYNTPLPVQGLGITAVAPDWVT